MLKRSTSIFSWIVLLLLIGVIFGGLQSNMEVLAAKDIKPPSVKITEPLTGATLSAGTMIVKGTSSDNRGGSGVNNVKVHFDGGSFVNALPKGSGDWSTWSFSTYIPSVGSHTIEAKATDNAGNTKLHSIKLTVVDSTPPTIATLSDITVEAAGPTTLVLLEPPLVQDQVDPSPSLLSDAPPAFPIGITIVTWTAQDFSGNTATVEQVVQVVDTTSPSIIPPIDISALATGVKTIVNLGSPTVTDIADLTPVVVNNAPSQGFGLGDTIVTWTATDDHGNSASAIQLITIIDEPNDRFGVKKIYPTKADGNEWNMNEDDIVNDPSFSAIPSASNACTTPKTCTLLYKNNDNTTWHAGRMDVSANEGIRLVVSSAPDKLWLNTEMTGYYRLTNSTFYPQEFIHVLRSGTPHASTCEGYSYYAGITYDGNVAKVQKSLYHGGDRLGYSQTIYSKGITTPMTDRWIGMKTIAYNLDNSAVKIEIWLDDLANNEWHKVFEQVDSGWSIAGDPSAYGCLNPLTGQPRESTDIILWGGTEQQFRADNAEMDFKWLSIREVSLVDT